ncbi:hypothetical protein DPSP01_009070 [Paraphaeosphaeria sporulosa]|uniref:Ankyrin n=1 Tax=Paraphaeosphaeria sporulosa TaxID=1460663 RepID=A0A177C8K8_9PLEO|nr:uncharacterized protein CC84DRAFT_872138 [Paraphaeosphaeria sporulosa]OAG03885.1 hypothetical protein CC84DRAFT_872138 [Paraphaeosphaeria sporulosa]
MSTNSTLQEFNERAKAACERDDTSLMEQAFSSYPDPPDRFRYSLHLAIQINAEKVLIHLIEDRGLDVQHLPPTVVARAGRSTAILELLLAHGWDINWRHVSESGPDAEPYMWHIVGDGDLVAWCLEHGATLSPIRQERLHPNVLTQSQLSCRQVLECAAAKGSVATFELLRSKGAPLGWRPLHLAVRTAGVALDRAAEVEERMAMVRHLIDVVGVEVNALDHPVGKKTADRQGTPIVYVAELSGLKNLRELTWLLLDRGADPAPGLEEARESDHVAFVEDVDAWKAQHRNAGKSWLIMAKARIFGQ